MSYIIRGRNIDGTVYWDARGWASDRHDAHRFEDRQFAQETIAVLIAGQSHMNSDERTGQLRVIDAPPKTYGRWRKDKRFGSPFDEPVYNAMIWGEDQGERGRSYRNPYPPGKRHDAFKSGYDHADPLGRHHGRNE